MARLPGKKGEGETPFPHQFCCMTLLRMLRDEQNIRYVDMLSDAALMLHKLHRQGFHIIDEPVRYRNEGVFAPISACNKKVADKRKIVAWPLRLAAPLRLGAPGSSMAGCVNGKGGIVNYPCVGHGSQGLEATRWLQVLLRHERFPFRGRRLLPNVDPGCAGRPADGSVTCTACVSVVSDRGAGPTGMAEVSVR